MQMGKFVKILLLLIFTSNCKVVISQNKFVKYQDFEIAYHNNSDLNKLSKHYDLLEILLLDSFYVKQILEYNPRLENLFRGYAYGLSLDEQSVGFTASISDVTDVFNSNLYIDKIFNCVYDNTIEDTSIGRISYPVYIKDNTALFDIITNSGIDTYCLKAGKVIVKIFWLGGTAE